MRITKSAFLLKLEEIGVTGNFGSGTSLKVIVDHIVKRVREKRAK